MKRGDDPDLHSPISTHKSRRKRRRRQGWDIHYGYILHLIGMDDAGIAGALGITEAAVTKRRRLKWQHGHA